MGSYVTPPQHGRHLHSASGSAQGLRPAPVWGGEGEAGGEASV